VTANERAMRFGYLLSEIEMHVRMLLRGEATDTVAFLALISLKLDEAREIAAEVSREALDKVTRP
jgi:hypothetical protein